MNFKILNINDITDSREVIENKPNRFIFVTIYIFIALIITFLLWSWFTEKEVVIKASGIVKPDKEVYAVSNVIPGKIKKIKVKDGQNIKKGEILYIIDDEQLKDKKDKIDTQIKYLNNEIDNLNKLNKSIINNTNYFNDSINEKEYYYRFKSYEAGNDISLENKNSLNMSKKDLNSQLNKLQILEKSINDDKNYNEGNTVYSEEYNNYKLSKKDIEENINTLKKSKKDLENINNKTEQIKLQINQINREINTNKIAISKLKSDSKLKVEISINEIKSKLNNIYSNLEDEKENLKLSKRKNKESILAQIEEKLSSDKEKLKEINLEKNLIKKELDNCIVKANNDGKLNFDTKLEPGLILQQGTIVANILPEEELNKVQLIIPDKDIGTIKIGQDIKYSFSSLPYEEYGFLSGNLENLSVDSKFDSDKGIVYFTGDGTLNKDVVYSNNGESEKIKTGMTCEAKIITRKEKMLYYLLEKLGLKNNK